MLERSERKTRKALVLSNKMDKTVVVQTERLVRHPRYGKVIKVKNKFKVHDEAGRCQVGDIVMMMETRPLSKEKRWRVVEIIGHEELTKVKEEKINDSESNKTTGSR